MLLTLGSTPRRGRALARLNGLMLVGLLLSALGACGGRPTGSIGPTEGAISHPTGADELVLRVFVGGGFVPPGYLATEAPAFSLYGDGTVIVRDGAAAAPTPVNGVSLGAPFRTARLSEAQVQALLADALDTGGLRTAAAQYVLPIADAPSTVFTVNAEGRSRQVSVNGLGLANGTGSDSAALTALAGLRDRLLGFGATLAGAVAWEPASYRGYLLDTTGVSGVAIPWPWTTFTPATWTNVSDASSSLPFPTRTMTRQEVEALGLGPLTGGAIGIVVTYPRVAGKAYGISLRPLLPDETS